MNVKIWTASIEQDDKTQRVHSPGLTPTALTATVAKLSKAYRRQQRHMGALQSMNEYNRCNE